MKVADMFEMMDWEDGKSRTFSLADPDRAPGAVDREHVAVTAAQKRTITSNQNMIVVADLLGESAVYDSPVEYSKLDLTINSRKVEFIKVTGMDFNTDAGTQIKMKLDFEPFHNGIALYVKYANTPQFNRDATAQIANIWKQNVGKSLDGIQYSEKKMIEKIDLCYFVDDAKKFADAILGITDYMIENL